MLQGTLAIEEAYGAGITIRRTANSGLVSLIFELRVGGATEPTRIGLLSARADGSLQWTNSFTSTTTVLAP